MFGYLRANSSFLSDTETNIYQSYYCGICASLRKRYGLTATFLLSYEAAFFALLSAAVNGDTLSIETTRCPANIFRKKTIRSGTTIDAAADINMLLAYKSMEDNIRDESPLWHIPAWFYEKRFSAACQHIHGFRSIISLLDSFNYAESAADPTTDSVAHCSGLLISEILGSVSIKQHEYLSELGYQLGRWIYIMDAYDDLYHDIRRKRFNPIAKDFNISAKDFTTSVQTVSPLIGDSLFLTLDHIRKYWENIETSCYGDLLSNIFLLGLRKVTCDTLNKYSLEVEHDKRPVQCIRCIKNCFT